MRSGAVIETDRLILRRFEPGDVEALHDLYSDPEVMRFYRTIRTLHETHRSLIRLMEVTAAHGTGLWATVLKAEDKLIGRCGLIDQVVDGEKEVEIGTMLARDYWGRGLATEAAKAIGEYGFNELGRTRLISLIDPNNVRSEAVARRIGMKLEKQATIWHVTDNVFCLERS